MELKIEKKAATDIVLDHRYWADIIHDQVPWCELDVLREWVKEWLQMLYLDAKSSFDDKNPTAGNLAARLELKLRIRLKGDKTRSWLQGHTAELQAKRENDENRDTRWRPSPEDYKDLEVGYIRRTPGKDDSSGPEGAK